MNRTHLGHFAEGYDVAIRPFLGVLRQTAQLLSSVPDEVPGREILVGLRQAEQDLGSLLDETAQERASIVVFGPLKAGKSTLINAMAASYVTKVGSLPMYPCMVRFTHGARWCATLARYDGLARTLQDPTELSMQLQRAHVELSERLRQTGAPASFEAATSYPEAIRSLEVRIPVDALAQTGCVLVETPYLHGRLRFGYADALLDLGDRSACAIVVVRTQDLFQGAAFEGFHALLERFGTVFLVVNLDSRKEDLAPEGGSVASIERQDPLRIIEVFEALTMDGRLRAAMQSGALRLYPIDLLSAASRRLQEVQVVPDADRRRALATDAGESAHGEAGFETFLEEVTALLDRDPRAKVFLASVLERSARLLDAVSALCQAPGLASLPQRAERLSRDLETARARRAALERLAQIKVREWQWDGSFDALKQKLGVAADARARSLGEGLETAIDGALEGWFRSNDGFGALVADRLLPALEGGRRDIAHAAYRALVDDVTRPGFFAQLGAETREDIERAGVDVANAARLAAGRVDLTSPHALGAPLTTADVPVRRRLPDWLLLRTGRAVRKRLFGPVEAPRQPVSAELKAGRLAAARPALQAVLARRLRGFHEAEAKDAAARLHERFLQLFVDALRAEVDESLQRLSGPIERLEARLAALQSARASVDELDVATGRAAEAFARLSEYWVQGEDEYVLQPVPGSGASRSGVDEPLVAEDAEAFETADESRAG